jgi:hypothetical protein
MKDSRIIRFSIVLVVIAMAGCGKPPSPAPVKAPAAPAEKGSIQTAVDGFTGKTAVDAGMRAKDQIKAASEARNRNLEEVGQ